MNASPSAASPQPLSINGWRVARWPKLDSTSNEARAQALAGDAGRLWVLADEQTAGRGRHGRVWQSPKGNFFGSALIVDPCEPALAPQIGFVAGVALRRAVGDLGAAPIALKWPNDLVSDGAKLAGLLIEGVQPPGRKLCVVVGFGVNLVASPAGLPYAATDLSRLDAPGVSPLLLLERLTLRFDEALAIWKRGAGFAAIREIWLAAAAGLGQPIRISDPRGVREGIFEGLDAQGRMTMRSSTGMETVEAADITLLPPAAAAPGGVPPLQKAISNEG